MKDSYSRFSKFSFTSQLHKGKVIKNIHTSPKWSELEITMGKMSFNLAVIPAGMEGRPDLISNDVFGTPNYWWLICTANNILDPFEELKAGKTIKIPII
tara:strand:- start:1729 stop:2025 length:297 start_codon:yes stop_codon:yes gene_type:complete